MIPPAGAAIGIGSGRCRLRTTFLVLSPILLYVLATIVWNLTREKLHRITGVIDDKATVKVCGTSEKTFRVEMPVGPK